MPGRRHLSKKYVVLLSGDMVNLIDEQSNPTFQTMISLQNYIVEEKFILI